MTLPPGLGECWLDRLRRLPERASSNPVAELPPRLPAVDAAEQFALELGGACVALRRRGCSWLSIARALDVSRDEALALGRAYALRAAGELMRDAGD